MIKSLLPYILALIGGGLTVRNIFQLKMSDETPKAILWVLGLGMLLYSASEFITATNESCKNPSLTGVCDAVLGDGQERMDQKHADKIKRAQSNTELEKALEDKQRQLDQMKAAREQENLEAQRAAERYKAEQQTEKLEHERAMAAAKERERQAEAERQRREDQLAYERQQAQRDAQRQKNVQYEQELARRVRSTGGNPSNQWDRALQEEQMNSEGYRR